MWFTSPLICQSRVVFLGFVSVALDNLQAIVQPMVQNIATNRYNGHANGGRHVALLPSKLSQWQTLL